MEDSYQSNLAGIALPKGNASRLAYMSEFLARLKRDGSLQGIINSAELRGIVSGTLLPPCKARFEPQDANRLWHIGSHIWSTI